MEFIFLMSDGKTSDFFGIDAGFSERAESFGHRGAGGDDVVDDDKRKVVQWPDIRKTLGVISPR